MPHCHHLAEPVSRAFALCWTLNMSDRLGINYMAARKTDFSFSAIFFIFGASSCKPRGSQIDVRQTKMPFSCLTERHLALFAVFRAKRIDKLPNRFSGQGDQPPPVRVATGTRGISSPRNHSGTRSSPKDTHRVRSGPRARADR